MSANAMREMVMLPENRPAMRLLMRSTMYMVGIPIAVYYFCFNTVFGEQGLSPVHDFNWRVNYSGFAAIAAVQLVIAHHVVSAFQQDAADMAREAEIKREIKAAHSAARAHSPTSKKDS